MKSGPIFLAFVQGNRTRVVAHQFEPANSRNKREVCTCLQSPTDTHLNEEESAVSLRHDAGQRVGALVGLLKI